LARETVAVRINLPETDLKHIDEFTNAHGLTRSEFLLRAAIREMKRS
jgi:metal-responsive CopG/Arc/MetJ family transcriptional regulator